jgi:quercetin dioxygenase-like cupin family protein
MQLERPRAIAVPPHEGKVLDILGVRNKLTASQTNGAIYLFESEFGPGDGNPLHVHRNEDELGYVVAGALLVRLGDQTLEVGTGGIAYLPKNIPHALRNPLATRSRYLFAAIPGGFLEHWFEAIQTETKAGRLNDTLYRELCLQYGIEWLE